MKKKITIALVMVFAVLAYITCTSQALDVNAEGMSVTMGGKTLETGFYWYVGDQLQDVSQTAPDAAVTSNYIHYDASTGTMTVYGNFSTADKSGIQIDGGILILSGTGNFGVVSNVDGVAGITGNSGAGIKTEEGFAGEISIGGLSNANAVSGLTTLELKTTSNDGIRFRTDTASTVFIDASTVSLNAKSIIFDDSLVAGDLSGIIKATGDINLVSEGNISIDKGCSGAMFTGSNVTLESTSGEINLKNMTSGIATGNLTMSAAGDINIEASDAVAKGDLNITGAQYIGVTSNAVTVEGSIKIDNSQDVSITSLTASVCKGNANILASRSMGLVGRGDAPIVGGALTVNPYAAMMMIGRINNGSAPYTTPFAGTYPSVGMVQLMETTTAGTPLVNNVCVDGVVYTNRDQNTCEHPLVDTVGECVVCQKNDIEIAELNNGTKYTSLSAAVRNATDGATVKLLYNCDASATILEHGTELSNKKIIIDLGGHKLQIQEIDTERALTIQNGTFYGSINNTYVGGNEKLTLDNLHGEIKDLQWMPDAGVQLENSRLSVTSSLPFPRVWFEKLSMDETSVFNIKNAMIKNYGSVRFGNVKDALGGIEEFLPYGYQLAQKQQYTGGDTYNTVVDENGELATNILLKYKRLTDPEAVITVDTSSVVYDGTSKVPAVTVSYDGVVLVANRNYRVTYNNNVNVGTATIHIEGIGVYHDSVDKTFVIGKANQAAPTGLVPTAETIDGKNDGKIANLSSKMEYSVDNRTWIDANAEVLTNLPDGDYYVRFKETANYYASPSTKVTVAKGTIPTQQDTTESTTTQTTTTQETKVETPKDTTTQTPATGITDKKADKTVSTGDAYPIAIVITLMIGTGVCITGMVRRRKEEK